jgi:hypothetical protein
MPVAIRGNLRMIVSSSATASATSATSAAAHTIANAKSKA